MNQNPLAGTTGMCYLVALTKDSVYGVVLNRPRTALLVLVAVLLLTGFAVKRLHTIPLVSPFQGVKPGLTSLPTRIRTATAGNFVSPPTR